MPVIPPIDPLTEVLPGRAKTLTISCSQELIDALERARVRDGYGGSQRLSPYVRLLLVAALRAAEDDAKAAAKR